MGTAKIQVMVCLIGGMDMYGLGVGNAIFEGGCAG